MRKKFSVLKKNMNFFLDFSLNRYYNVYVID